MTIAACEATGRQYDFQSLPAVSERSVITVFDEAVNGIYRLLDVMLD